MRSVFDISRFAKKVQYLKALRIVDVSYPTLCAGLENQLPNGQCGAKVNYVAALRYATLLNNIPHLKTSEMFHHGKPHNCAQRNLWGVNATPGIYVEDVALSQYQGNSEPINETSPTFSFFKSFYPTITLRSIVGFPMVQRLRRFQRVTSFKPVYTLTVSLSLNRRSPICHTNNGRLAEDDVYRITNYVKAVRILCDGVGSGELLLMG